MEDNKQLKIVIVEDNTDLANIYKTRLEMLGYTCFIAYNGIIGLYFIQKEIPDLVLLDLMVPDIAGDQILRTMRGSLWGKDIPVYVVSNLSEADAPSDLRDLGIAGYAVKANLSDDQIDQIVNHILRPYGAEQPSVSIDNQASAV
jgi:two-component system phosphate regulon response regulator PhoB